MLLCRCCGGACAVAAADQGAERSSKKQRLAAGDDAGEEDEEEDGDDEEEASGELAQWLGTVLPRAHAVQSAKATLQIVQASTPAVEKPCRTRTRTLSASFCKLSRSHRPANINSSIS
jgi:hypothetical protein